MASDAIIIVIPTSANVVRAVFRIVDRDSIMSEAPDIEREYIRVPKISSEGTD